VKHTSGHCREIEAKDEQEVWQKICSGMYAVLSLRGVRQEFLNKDNVVSVTKIVGDSDQELRSSR